MWLLQIFIEILFSPLGLIIIIPIGFTIARILVERKIAKRNAEIEYNNQKQAYKDAIRELEKEKEGK